MYLLSRPDRETRLAGIFERALAPLRSPIQASIIIDLPSRAAAWSEEIVTPKET